MNLTYLGGVEEVGRSCIVATIKGKNIMLDCGIKASAEGTGKYPNFDKIPEGTYIDTIIIYHAHMDHAGALPLAVRKYPNAKIYMTEPTADIVYMMLQDIAKIMDSQEDDIPIYDYDDIEIAMQRTIRTDFGRKYNIGNGIKVSMYSSGHILGAAAILLESSEGTLLYTGDYTTVRTDLVDPQSFSGYIKNRSIRINTMITEGTYGNVNHPDRKSEIERLINDIKATLSTGGKVLIPSFALGRAQEVLMILKQALEREEFNCPVYIDGIIRFINYIYPANYKYLPQKQRRIFEKKQDLFCNPAIKNINGKERISILSKDSPCIIIASSGMLIGGTSVIYAKELSKDSRNLIAFIGYQDPDSPGGIMCKNAGESIKVSIGLDGEVMDINCVIKKYSFSAHADKQSIKNVINEVNPDKVILVHGEHESLKSLLEELSSSYNVAIPKIDA